MKEQIRLFAPAMGVVFLVLVWVVMALFVYLSALPLRKRPADFRAALGRGLNPLNFIEGADGQSSTSKFQFLVWTMAVLFAYVSILVAKAFVLGDYTPISDIPRNVLIALGLSSGTAVAAKGITVGYVGSGRVNKPPASDPAPAAGTNAPTGGPVAAAAPSPVPAGAVQQATNTLGAAVDHLRKTQGAIDASQAKMVAAAETLVNGSGDAAIAAAATHTEDALVTTGDAAKMAQETVDLARLAQSHLQSAPPSPGTSKATPGPVSPAGLGAIFLDDEGYPDLGKIQIIAFTAIAVIIFIFAAMDQVASIKAASAEGASNSCQSTATRRAAKAAATPTPAAEAVATPSAGTSVAGAPTMSAATTASKGACESLPDIDGALMVLMGLSSGAYIGKKLVSVDTPRLSGLSKGTAAPGESVTIFGSSLTDNAAGNAVTVNGSPIPSDAATDWHDGQVEFALPTSDRFPPARDWAAGQLLQIGVVVNGVPGNSLPLTLGAHPGVTFDNTGGPQSGPADGVIQLQGRGFGASQLEKFGLITFDGVPWFANLVTRGRGNVWTDGLIVFKLPATDEFTAARTWQPGTNIKIGVVLNGSPSTSQVTYAVA